jgi:D-tagatose-1,6-bisphosphate aldolase subunit GatZ/KbaZ
MTYGRCEIVLEETVAAQKRGEAKGLYSVCSANPFVLDAAIQQALEDVSPLVIEATCNQVNQFGGYTGMTPKDFYTYIHDRTSRLGLPVERLILGGDHLGPSVWQDEPSESAMEKAHVLVEEYVQAGFTKLHLDASMPLGEDPPGPLDAWTATERCAELCKTAEMAGGEGASCLRYVIGTEVPLPGGARGAAEEDWVTQIEQARNTIDFTRRAFANRDLDKAWERVRAVVVQPGVEFGDQIVVDYRPESARELSRFIEPFDHLVYEAHSTDYQLPEALKQLVADHFAILKVGPALTFALREIIFALANIEYETLSGKSHVQLSQVREKVERAMLENSQYWEKYYRGTPEQVALARKYSYSERIRYYWSNPMVQEAVERLIQNLEDYPPPNSVISQFLPLQYWKLRTGNLKSSPRAMIQDAVQEVLRDYAYACGWRSYPAARSGSSRR